MLKFQEPEYLGLRKVISGGQEGADEGGLAGAKAMRVKTGGTAPLNFRTDRGPKPEQAELYGLVEHSSYAYPPRTLCNVRDSDGTLIIAHNPNSPGCTLTVRYCREQKKPFLVLQAHREYESVSAEENAWQRNAVEQTIHWMKQNRIEVLNVAGNRDRGKDDDFHFLLTRWVVADVIAELDDQGLIIRE